MGHPSPFGLSTAEQATITRALTAPMLDRETEMSLTRNWLDHQDRPSLDRLIASYMRLVIATARRSRHYGLPMSDLIQEGVIGLLEAANRFDPDRNVRFSTYATWWVKSSVQDFVLRNWSIVRTGTTTAHKSLFFNLKRIRAQIGAHSDKPMSDAERQEVADLLRVRRVDVEVMEGRLSGVDRSLNATLAEDGDMQWIDTLPSKDPSPEEVSMNVHDTARIGALLAEAMQDLTEREVTIITRRQMAEDQQTLADLGRMLGISKERVRQVESKALEKLRVILSHRVGDPWEAGLLKSA